MCPRSGFGGPLVSNLIAFFCQVALQERLLEENVGAGEHRPKPPFWETTLVLERFSQGSFEAPKCD